MKFYLPLLLSFCLPSSGIKAYPDLQQPLEIPMELSANFGELRSNHFHSGIDFKTLQQEGQPVYAVEDGYVSRVTISGVGYGNCVYVTHPQLNLISVYAHLQSMEPFIDSLVKQQQYAEQRFDMDIPFSPEAMPVKRGQRIASSGNSGSSGGPHLHFELREADTSCAIDPQLVYDVPDDTCPRFHKISVYPKPGEGSVQGLREQRDYAVIQVAPGHYALKGNAKIKAWGRIGMEVKANDYMTGTSNFYGVKVLQMRVDSTLWFHYDNTRVSMDSTRFINSFIDYARWYDQREMLMRCFVPPHHCSMYLPCVQGDGMLCIDEQRNYSVHFLIEDIKGNRSELELQIQGDSCDIPRVEQQRSPYEFQWWRENAIHQDSINFVLPADALYDNVCFQFHATSDSLGFSPIYQLHYPQVPLQKRADLRIKLTRDDLPDKRKYYIAHQDRFGQWEYIGHQYEDGWMSAHPNVLGTFTVRCDTVPPHLRLLAKNGGKVVFKGNDDQSGIQSWEGRIDGAWALFVWDAKYQTFTYVFDPTRITKGKTHTVDFCLIDHCGNETTLHTKVKW